MKDEVVHRQHQLILHGEVIQRTGVGDGVHSLDAVKAELEAYKESLSANDLYAEFADKVALAKDARIVTNGNYVAIVIAGIANPDYAPIDTALETALNF